MVDDLSGYSQAISALFARTTSGTKLGLERTRELLNFLGNPERRFPSIHIAGTNGKGSVVASCDAILRAKGLRVGRYTSPHLIDFRERVLVSGIPITEREVLRFLERTTDLAEKLGATFFELTTALAFGHFSDANVDVAVIETGLGGRLDSTNTLDPEVAVVTSIGLDHTDLLGSSVELIAGEKAGIFKRGVPAVIGETDPGTVKTLKSDALRRGVSSVTVVGDVARVSDVSVAPEGTAFTLTNSGGEHRLRTRLIGAHQAWNAAIAMSALEALSETLRPNWTQIARGLDGVSLPGRFQRVGKYLFDVAHNPDAARILAATIASVRLPKPRTAVIAVLRDKDWRGVIEALRPVVDSFIITNAPSAPPEREWNPHEVVAWAKSEGVNATLEAGLDIALTLAAEKSETVVVTGSFHTVGDAMSCLQVSPFAA